MDDDDDGNRRSRLPVDQEDTDPDPGQLEDAAIDDSVSSLSIASTRWNYFLEHGRWYQDYHNIGYAFPQDDGSLRNEGWTQLLMLYLFDDKHFLAPVDASKLRNVLDVGTGHGLWPENVADAHPDCHITALDTLPKTTVHPNITFQNMDISQEWIFDNEDLRFDLIHLRALFGTLSSTTWPGVYEQSLRFLRPGGWVEHIEYGSMAYCDDGTEKADSLIVRLAHLSHEMGGAMNLEFSVAEQAADRLRAAGFINVRETKYKLPLGQWWQHPRYKEIGRLFEHYYKTGLHGWLIAPLTRGMKFPEEDVDDFCKRAFDEIDSGQHHYYFYL
ncbi:hypothetical protein DV738_g1952, partial [Chaetothyriales sp. CBS 135597]